MRSVADKRAALEAMAKEVKTVRVKAEKEARPFDDEAPARGCGFCSVFGRRRGSVRVQTAEPGSAASATRSSALFGVGSKKSANAKLAEAALAMEARVATLEERARQGRLQAAALMKAGNRAQAMRSLKKAKLAEKQHAATAAALDAVESQVDMLEGVAVQRQLASALAGTSKSLKANKKLLAQAEGAVDEAGEARDLASDLDSVLADWAGNSSLQDDEDDLVAELEAMCDDSTEVTSASGVEVEMAAREAVERERAELREKLAAAEYAHAERLRQGLPEAPSSKTSETRNLLQPG